MVSPQGIARVKFLTQWWWLTSSVVKFSCQDVDSYSSRGEAGGAKTEICTDSLARFTASGNASDYYWQDGKTKGTAVLISIWIKRQRLGWTPWKWWAWIIMDVDSASLEVKMRTVPVITMPDSVSHEFDSVQLVLNSTGLPADMCGMEIRLRKAPIGRARTRHIRRRPTMTNCPSAVYDIKVHEILRRRCQSKQFQGLRLWEWRPITLTAETLDPLQPADRYEWNNGSTESSISVNKAHFCCLGYLHGCVGTSTLCLSRSRWPQSQHQGREGNLYGFVCRHCWRKAPRHYFWKRLHQCRRTLWETDRWLYAGGCRYVQLQGLIKYCSAAECACWVWRTVCHFVSLTRCSWCSTQPDCQPICGMEIRLQESTYWAGRTKIYTAQAYDDLNCPSAVYMI